MKKKSIIGRLAALAMALCLVTMSLTAGTLAKYASETSGTASATVAAWKIAFKDGTGPSANTYTGTTAFTLNLKDTAQETADLVKTNMIAPGTKGSFDFVVDATGTEVAYTYTIEMDLSGTGLDKAPIAFSTDNFATTAALGSDTKIKLTGDVKVSDITANPVKAITVSWKWDSTNYDTTMTDEDKRDTKVGEASAASTLSYTIPVTIKAEQKVS